MYPGSHTEKQQPYVYLHYYSSLHLYAYFRKNTTSPWSLGGGIPRLVNRVWAACFLGLGVSWELGPLKDGFAMLWA